MAGVVFPDRLPYHRPGASAQDAAERPRIGCSYGFARCAQSSKRTHQVRCGQLGSGRQRLYQTLYDWSGLQCLWMMSGGWTGPMKLRRRMTASELRALPGCVPMPQTKRTGGHATCNSCRAMEKGSRQKLRRTGPERIRAVSRGRSRSSERENPDANAQAYGTVTAGGGRWNVSLRWQARGMRTGGR